MSLLRRSFAKLLKRNSKLRHYIPKWVVRSGLKIMSYSSEFRSIFIRKAHHSRFDYVLHCTEHKSGSQWIKAVLSDALVYKGSGYSHYHMQSRLNIGADLRPLGKRSLAGLAAPKLSIISPLYIAYNDRGTFPYKNAVDFFVTRNPRELMVSWFFSTKKNHIDMVKSPDNTFNKARRDLAEITDVSDGIDYAINYWNKLGRFSSIISWYEAAADGATLIFKYEDFIVDSSSSFKRLFSHLDIKLNPEEFSELIEVYSFESLTGRKIGESNDESHMRGGGSSSYEKYWNERHENRLKLIMGEWLDKYYPE